MKVHYSESELLWWNVDLMCLANIVDWFRLINSKGVGAKTFWGMLDKYGTAERALLNVAHPFPEKDAIKIIKSFKGQIIIASDSSFPPELKKDRSCPPMLFAMGDISLLKERKIAIIGARNASLYGKSIAANLGENLSRYCAIVSGLASGIDTSAHLGCLKNESGKPIAVMPFSLNNIYPRENAELFEKVVAKGVAISEVPPHRNPDQGMFHARNRIIANLSIGVVVVEAALKSGTFSTAKLALDCGTEVLAVPGCPADPRAGGGNYLIKNGAPLIENYLDVLENMNISVPSSELFAEERRIQMKRTKSKGENSILEQKILNMLSVDVPVNIEIIAYSLNAGIPEILSNISELEIQGKIRKCSANEVMLSA